MTTNDFENASWHDNKVYSITFPDNKNCFKLDIDFILEWVKEEQNSGYKFIVAPTILTFENVSNFSVKIEQEDFAEIFINEIKITNKRLSPNGKVLIWDFIIILDKGEITFTSTGYSQNYTAAPKLCNGQKYNR